MFSLRSLLVLLLLILASAVSMAGENKAGPEEELEALIESYGNAMQEFWILQREAKTQAEQYRLMEEENPDKIYLLRFQKLAEKAGGTETAVKAYIWAVQLGISGNCEEAIRNNLDTLFAYYVDSPEMAGLAATLNYTYGAMGQDKRMEILRKLYEETINREVKASSLFYQAQMLKTEEAYKLFKTLREDFGDTLYGKQAESYIYEIENLQTGMVAPDFSATDQYMINFNLSDYRGKVVVIHFWGFW